VTEFVDHYHSAKNEYGYDDALYPTHELITPN